MISDSLRFTVFSGVRKNPRESCMVMVSRPVMALPRDVDPERLGQAKKIDAAMLEERRSSMARTASTITFGMPSYLTNCRLERCSASNNAVTSCGSSS